MSVIASSVVASCCCCLRWFVGLVLVVVDCCVFRIYGWWCLWLDFCLVIW